MSKFNRFDAKTVLLERIRERRQIPWIPVQLILGLDPLPEHDQ